MMFLTAVTVLDQLTAEFFPMDPLNVPHVYVHVFQLQVGFEAANMTQVPLQPSCTHSRLNLHPLSNELAIVMALGQWSSLQSGKIASLPEMEALHGQNTVF